MGIRLLPKSKKQINKYEAIRKEVATELSLSKQALDPKVLSENTWEYIQLMLYIDRNQNNGFVRIKGLDTLDSTHIVNALYSQPTLVFYTEDSELRFGIPVYRTWDRNGKPLSMTAMSLFGEKESRELYNDVDCVLLFDTVGASHTRPSRAQLVRVLLNDMGRLYNKIQTNVLLSGDKLVYGGVAIENQQDMYNTLLDQYQSNNPILIYDTMLGNKIDIAKTDSKFGELWSCLKQYDILRMQLHGLGDGSVGTVEKKGNLIDSEQSAMTDNPTVLYQNRKYLWELWKEKMNKVLSINVELEFVKEVMDESNQSDGPNSEQYTTSAGNVE